MIEDDSECTDTSYQSDDLQNSGQNVARDSSNEPIDTSKLIAQLNATLKAQNINRQFFAHEFLFRSVVAFDNMVEEPVKTWTKCSRTIQLVYRKIQEFLDSKSSQKALKAKQSKLLKGRRSMRLLFKSKELPLSQKVPFKNLHTASVAQRLTKALRKRKLELSAFATDCLGSNFDRVSWLLKKPIQWRRCSKYERSLYKKMHDWLICEEGNF